MTNGRDAANVFLSRLAPNVEPESFNIGRHLFAGDLTPGRILDPRYEPRWVFKPLISKEAAWECEVYEAIGGVRSLLLPRRGCSTMPYLCRFR